MAEMPFDVLNNRFGKLVDSGVFNGYFDNTAAAADIDTELQSKFLFFPIAELEERQEQIEDGGYRYFIGEGYSFINVDKNEDPAALYIRAENALALYWKLKKEADEAARRAARVPAAGLYRMKLISGKHTTAIVTSDGKIRVLMPKPGIFIDMTNAIVNGDRDWEFTILSEVDGAQS